MLDKYILYVEFLETFKILKIRELFDIFRLGKLIFLCIKGIINKEKNEYK